MTDSILTWAERLGEQPSTMADTFGSMDSEIHDLRAYANLLEKQLKDAQVAAIAEAAEVDRLTAERDALALDAARYRWLRTANNDGAVLYGDTSHCELMMEEELDKAIDKAMKGTT